MINLITGGPGSGKTCYLIGELLKYQKEERRLFVHGVPGLTIDHTRIYCESTTCTVCEDKPEEGALYAKDWPDFVTAGDVVIVDEVQHCFRPRGSKSTEIPRGVASLETSRHLGVDFWFITQHPNLVDINVRRMVTRHIHIKYNSVYGRVKFEWAECQTDPTQNWTPDTIKSTYRLNKKHYPYYKSADLHTKQVRKIPSQLYWFGAVLIAFPFIVYSAIEGMTTLDERIGVVEEVAAPPLGESSNSGLARNILNSDRRDTYRETENQDPFDRVPEHPLFPESAPAYVDLVEIKDYPRIAGCIYSEAKNLCQCYTQQATRLPIPFGACRAWIEDTPFNPYLEPDRAAGSQNYSSANPSY